MFYTLVSRIPMISNFKTNKFLIVFILGSLAYIVLHYYLFSGKNYDIVDTIRGYIYYVITIDLIIAWFLTRMTTDNSCDDDEPDNYTQEQRQEIENNLQQLRQAQQTPAEVYKQRLMQLQMEQQNKQTKQNSNDNENSSQQSPFMTRNEVEESERNERQQKKAKSKSSEKKSSSSCSSYSSSVEKQVQQEQPEKTKKQKKVKVSNVNEDDTNIPVYMGCD